MNTDSNGEKQHKGEFDEVMRGREELGQAVAQPVGDDPKAWLSGVQQAAHRLFEIIEKHELSTEREGGMLANVAVRRPHLMHATQRLQHEHDDMLHRLAEIEVETERQIAAEDYNLDLVRLQVQVVRNILLLHLARTHDLLFEAYIRVEGVGD